MSALRQHRLTVASEAGTGVDIIDRVFGSLADRMWDWFHANAEDELVRVSTLFGLVKVTVRVRHLHGFFEKVFGEDPRDKQGVL